MPLTAAIIAHLEPGDDRGDSQCHVIAFAHRIEIEVPTTSAEGPLLASIGWEVTTE